MQTCVVLCLLPWDVTPWEEKPFVGSWGWEAGRGDDSGAPLTIHFPRIFWDTALQPARRVANSSSALVTPQQLNNCPG